MSTSESDKRNVKDLIVLLEKGKIWKYVIFIKILDCFVFDSMFFSNTLFFEIFIKEG